MSEELTGPTGEAAMISVPKEQLLSRPLSSTDRLEKFLWAAAVAKADAHKWSDCRG